MFLKLHLKIRKYSHDVVLWKEEKIYHFSESKYFKKENEILRERERESLWESNNNNLEIKK